jgi:hypothetical protein
MFTSYTVAEFELEFKLKFQCKEYKIELFIVDLQFLKQFKNCLGSFLLFYKKVAHIQKRIIPSISCKMISICSI